MESFQVLLVTSEKDNISLNMTYLNLWTYTSHLAVLGNSVQELNTEILVMSTMLKTTSHGFYTKRYFSETDLKTFSLNAIFSLSLP